jgi:hypothetical protein
MWKGKVVPVLNELSTTPWRRVGSGSRAPPFLTSALDVGEWSASHPYRFALWEKSTRYPLDRRLDGPHSRSGRYGEEKDLAPIENLTPTLQPVAHHYTDWAILAPYYFIRSKFNKYFGYERSPSEMPFPVPSAFNSSQRMTANTAWVSWNITSVSIMLLDCVLLTQTETVIHHHLTSFYTHDIEGIALVVFYE